MRLHIPYAVERPVVPAERHGPLPARQDEPGVDRIEIGGDESQERPLVADGEPSGAEVAGIPLEEPRKANLSPDGIDLDSSPPNEGSCRLIKSLVDPLGRVHGDRRTGARGAREGEMHAGIEVIQTETAPCVGFPKQRPRDSRVRRICPQNAVLDVVGRVSKTADVIRGTPEETGPFPDASLDLPLNDGVEDETVVQVDPE